MYLQKVARNQAVQAQMNRQNICGAKFHTDNYKWAKGLLCGLFLCINFHQFWVHYYEIRHTSEKSRDQYYITVVFCWCNHFQMSVVGKQKRFTVVSVGCVRNHRRCYHWRRLEWEQKEQRHLLLLPPQCHQPTCLRSTTIKFPGIPLKIREEALR